MPFFLINWATSIMHLILKMMVILFVTLFISTTITYFVSVILEVPSDLEAELDFYIENKSLVSEVYSNCLTEYQVNNNRNCVNLSKASYSISVELSILKFDSDTDKKNILETELKLYSDFNYNLDYNIKKVSFITEESYILSLVYNIIAFFPKILGYLKSETILIKYTSEFNNDIFDLEKIKLFIYNNNLSIESARIIFLPKLGYLQYFIGKMYYITLFFTFFGVFYLISILYLWMFLFYFNKSKQMSIKKAE